jgi:heme/copper-type cytochrome/quinol oxidase subunit 3
MSARPIANTRSAAGMPTGLLAIWWVIASEVVIFGGLLMGYLMHRLAHDSWTADAANTNVVIGATNTFVLLTSSYFAVRGHKAAEEGDGKQAARWLWYCFGGGVLFLIFKSIEWTIEISHGYTITASTFWSFYYTAAGLHASHVIAGIIIMALVARKAARGIDLHHVELIGVYWHFVDIVWIFLFPLLYIAK